MGQINTLEGTAGMRCSGGNNLNDMLDIIV
jgi:hypothetical protein